MAMAMAMACLQQQKISYETPLISYNNKSIKSNDALPLISRRSAAAAAILMISSVVSNPQESLARERRNRKIIPLEDYQTTCMFSVIVFAFGNVKVVIISLYRAFIKLDNVVYNNYLEFEAADGLKYYDLVEGKGPVAEKGSTVQVYPLISEFCSGSRYYSFNTGLWFLCRCTLIVFIAKLQQFQAGSPKF